MFVENRNNPSCPFGNACVPDSTVCACVHVFMFQRVRSVCLCDHDEILAAHMQREHVTKKSTINGNQVVNEDRKEDTE